jgi:hypothetical protein
MSAFRFRKLPKAAREKAKSPQQLFQAVAQNIGKQVKNPDGRVDAERIEHAPLPAQVVYWAWRFQCEAGGSGIGTLLVDHLGIFAPQFHISLEKVGANELIRRLEAGIPLAKQVHAEFTRFHDQSWFEQFKPDPEFPSLQAVDKGVYPIVSSLTDLVAAFIDKNEGDFFE